MSQPNDATDTTDHSDKLSQLTEEFVKLRSHYKEQNGFDDDAVRKRLLQHIRHPKKKPIPKFVPSRRVIFLYVVPCVAALCLGIAFKGSYLMDAYEGLLETVYESECAVDQNIYSLEVSRPLFDCSICKGLNEMPVVHKISKQEFEEKYAYSAVPVLVKSATENWTALDTFSFNFFKTLYTKNKESLKSVEEDCQFFPYKTKFQNLSEALNMPEKRAKYLEGEDPWYFGWSNCDQKVRDELRQHYQTPYFLPAASESSIIDWIFMGGPGPGAYIHIDNVNRPSWQAQITGSKTWNLYPSSECEDVCSHLNVTMTPGDIFVVDTNQWYHSTFIHEGDLSITIGSEFD